MKKHLMGVLFSFPVWEDDTGAANPYPLNAFFYALGSIMKELIKIEVHNGTEMINARELHEFLGNGRKFSDWIKQRIGQYGFSIGVDFTNHKSVIGKATQIDYFITIDMAKELAMVENNKKGREIRRYFIEVEKRAKKMASPKIPQTYAEALRLAAEQAELLELMVPKAALAEDALRDEEEHYSITQAGKHIGLRQSEIFSILRAKSMLTTENLPTQKAIDDGILQLRTNTNCNGRNRQQAIMTMENIYNFQRRYCSK